MLFAQSSIDITPEQGLQIAFAVGLFLVGGVLYTLYVNWQDRQPQRRQRRAASGRGDPAPLPVERLQRVAPTSVPAPPVEVRPPVASAPDELKPAEWLRIVTSEPDRAPHFIIAGESGTGKTTVAQAILAQRGGLVAIADPKPKRPGAYKWGGLEYVSIGAGGDYQAIEALFVAVLAEVDRRLVQMRRSDDPFEPLTIVADEWLTLLAKCESAVKLYEIASIGRELGMRLIILSISDQVKPLKLDGRGDLRENFRFLRLGDKALTAQPEAARQHRPACLEWRGRNVLIDVETIDKLAAGAFTRSRVWPGVLKLINTDILGDLLGATSPSRDMASVPAPLPQSPGDSEGTPAASAGTGGDMGTEAPPSPAEIAFIAASLSRGMTVSQTAKAMRGYNGRTRARLMAKVEYVKGLLDDQGVGILAEGKQEPTDEAPTVRVA